MRRNELVRALLRSADPSVRWRVRVRVLGESRSTPRVQRLEKEVRRSDRVRRLLSHQHAAVRGGAARSVYHYWQGIHWVLGSLADLGYPPDDPELKPLVDRALQLWLRPWYLRTRQVTARSSSVRGTGVPVIRGRARRCASQQGNALYYVVKLDSSEARSRLLADLLLRWEWPDGGWNCDMRPEADTSSFMETLWPMRGLAAYAERTRDPAARRGVERAAEVFLERELFRRRSDGLLMKADFLRLHYPLYWHYDVLGGLKGMVEAGRVNDPRCSAALDWLEQKELPGGGWAADGRYYRVSSTFGQSAEYIDWGGTSRRTTNPWVTTDALWVLEAAGRLRT